MVEANPKSSLTHPEIDNIHTLLHWGPNGLGAYTASIQDALLSNTYADQHIRDAFALFDEFDARLRLAGNTEIRNELKNWQTALAQSLFVVSEGTRGDVIEVLFDTEDKVKFVHWDQSNFTRSERSMPYSTVIPDSQEQQRIKTALQAMKPLKLTPPSVSARYIPPGRRNAAPIPAMPIDPAHKEIVEESPGERLASEIKAVQLKIQEAERLGIIPADEYRTLLRLTSELMKVISPRDIDATQMHFEGRFGTPGPLVIKGKKPQDDIHINVWGACAGVGEDGKTQTQRFYSFAGEVAEALNPDKPSSRRI